MKRRLCVIVIMLLVIAAVLLMQNVSAATQATYYVSPSGSDSNPGTLDAPFRTIEKARDVVRTINSNMTGDIYVYLRGGTYALTSTLAFTQIDSGMNGYNVIYKNYLNEAPVISGGTTITGWTLYDAGKNIYRASVPSTLETRQLYVNGIRATRARSTGGLTGAVRNATGYTTTDTNMQNWGNKGDIEFVYDVIWTQQRIGVSTISGTTITMDQPAFDMATKHTNGVKADLPTYMENAYELLDLEGEWYLDRTAHYIFYKPRTGENMSTAASVAAALETLVSGTGTLASPIHNIQFYGIAFSYATWLRPNGTEGFAEMQANVCVNPNDIPAEDTGNWVTTPSNIAFNAAKSIRFERSKFTHLGAGGISFINGSQDNLIIGNEFTDISGSAITLGTSGDDHPAANAIIKNNDITNNYIHNIGAEYKGAVGILVFYTDDTNIAHNLITDLPYAAISVGWGWGGKDFVNNPTPSQNNKIQYNNVNDIMKYLYDGGGIYTLGAQPGTVISGNVVYDQRNEFGAIYLDEGSRYINVNNNIVYSNTRTALFKGVDHAIQYNYWDNDTNIMWWNWYCAVNNNSLVTNALVFPVSILNNAGLEASYMDIAPVPVPPSDQTAPSAPTNLTSPSKTSTTVDLSWTSSTDNVGVTGYEVYNGANLVGVTSGITFTVTNLAASTSYTFSVKARDAAKNLSISSLSINITTLAGPTLLASNPTGDILKLVVYNNSTQNHYYYNKLSTASYTFQSGDYIEYDVKVLDNVGSAGGIDIITTDGLNFRDQVGWQDQNGISGHPYTDIKDLAYGKWYHRKLAVPSSMLGKTVSRWDVAGANNTNNLMYTAVYDNIVVTNGAGIERNVVFKSLADVNINQADIWVSNATCAMNVVPLTTGSPSASGDKIKFTVTNNATKDHYYYNRFSKRGYVFQDGDYLEYDVKIDTDKGGIGTLEIVATDGTKARDYQPWLDQNGHGGAPWSSINLRAYNTWYHRKLPIPKELVGKQAAFFEVTGNNNTDNLTYTAYYDNVMITDGIDVNKQTIFSQLSDVDINQVDVSNNATATMSVDNY